MLKPYTVVMNGMETTLLLSEQDAKNRGLDFLKDQPGPELTEIVAERQGKAKKPANKNRTPANKRA